MTPQVNPAPPTLVYLVLAKAGLTLSEIQVESWKIMKNIADIEVKVKYREKGGELKSFRKEVTLGDLIK